MPITGYAYKYMNWLCYFITVAGSLVSRKLKRGGGKRLQESVGVKVRNYLLQWKGHLAGV